MMDQVQYEAALMSALESRKPDIAGRIQSVVRDLPEQAVGFDIGVHPHQDEEGFLMVWVHAVGPDLQVLNKAISDHRLLFEIRIEPGGKMSFGLPMFDPFGEDLPVGDIQVDTVVGWFKTAWADMSIEGFKRPVRIFGAEFGTKGVVKLN